jgi:hypothetical protein
VKTLYTAADGSQASVPGYLRSHLRQGFAHLPPEYRRFILHRMGRYAPWEREFDFTPPRLGDGEQSGPPEFVGIGVQKAGTTWWFQLVVAHAGISSPPGVHKERHFFDRFGAAPMTAMDVEDYHGWFPRPAGSITGEWTPDYFTLPWVPGLLRRAAPEARLLLLLRDPVERFRSGLDHHERMGMPRNGAAMADAVQRGFYYRALTQWLEHFPADQILILQHERCVVDPVGQLHRTFSHLGLPDDPAAIAVQPARVPSPAGVQLADEVKEYLIHLYSADVAALVDHVPEFDVTLWPNFA